MKVSFFRPQLAELNETNVKVENDEPEKLFRLPMACYTVNVYYWF